MKLTPLMLCLLAVSSAAFGQCFDDDLRGSYGFVGSSSPDASVTGVSVGTAFYSDTPIGAMVGLAGTGGTNAAGTLYFDGNGRIFGLPSTAFPQSITSDKVGTYAVSSDCTVKISVFDAFNDTRSLTSANNPALVGMIVRGGDEIYVTHAPSTGTVPLNPRVSIRFTRFSDRYSSGCTVSNVRGSYGLTGEGSTKAAGYATFFARVNFDGNGKLKSDTIAGDSSLGKFQYAGTYTLNADCSGTMTMNQSTTTVVARFAITPESAFVDSIGRAVSQNVQDLKPGLLFSISNGGQTITGVGSPQ